MVNVTQMLQSSGVDRPKPLGFFYRMRTHASQNFLFIRASGKQLCLESALLRQKYAGANLSTPRMYFHPRSYYASSSEKCYDR